jgi:hypothetical protein
MILRLDHLLDDLRRRGPDILAAIDTDPQLIRRQAGPFAIANAGKTLFTPLAPHHLYAKGIVYRRDPFELVSLPFIRVYNLGEREVQVGDLAALAAGPTARMHFLRKFDGTLIQRSQRDGRVFFTTRGMIEGAAAGGVPDEDAPDRLSHFDFLGSARRLARSDIRCCASRGRSSRGCRSFSSSCTRRRESSRTAATGRISSSWPASIAATGAITPSPNWGAWRQRTGSRWRMT